MTQEELLAKIYEQKPFRLALAESCTGGLVAHRITNIEGSSRYFWGGVVSYSEEAKIKILGVSPLVVEQYGIVSEEVALAMAKGIRRLAGADVALGLTGFAGPGGGDKRAGVGTVCFAVNFKENTVTLRKVFKGEREEIKVLAAEEALLLLIKLLKENLKINL